MFDVSLVVPELEMNIQGCTNNLMGTTGVVYQMLGAATAGGSATLGGTYPNNLQQAVCAGLQSGGQYFEIYSLDVLNANTAIQAVHQPSLCQ